MTLKDIINYIWQFPQNLCGILALNVYKPNKRYILDNGIEIYYSNSIDGSVSMGKYVIVDSRHWRDTVEETLKRDTVRHCAIGHTKQSEYLGWLYLPLISLPAFIARKTKQKEDYWRFWTEKWADKIANVNRYN